MVKKTVVKIPSNAVLQKKGVALGLTPAWITSLITTFGPVLVNLILQWLTDKKAGKLQGAAATNPVLSILLAIIVNDKDTVLQWINSGESSLYEALVALVGSKAAGLATLLEQWKANILNAVDGVDESVLDDIIAYLQQAN